MLPIHSKIETIFGFFLKTSKFPTASKSEHLKKKRIASHFHHFFKIQTNYKSISPNISVGKKTSNVSKQPEKIHTNYLCHRIFF